METAGTNRTNASKSNTEVDRTNYTNQSAVNSTINSNEIIFDVKCNELNSYNSEFDSNICNRCGNQDCKKKNECYAKSKSCFYCHKKGHIAKACLKLKHKNKNSETIKKVTEEKKNI